MRDIDTVLEHYIVAALWSSLDDEGNPLDARYTAADLAPETRESMRADVADFLALIDREGVAAEWWTDEQMGHDFWLTRNGHGAGFWDRGQDDGDRLTALTKPYGESYLYQGDDGRLWLYV